VLKGEKMLKNKKANVVANYLFILSIITVGIVLTTYLMNFYKKGKNIGENTGELDVKELGSNAYLIKTPKEYKVRISEELLVSNLQDLKFVIKAENGSTICTCYYNQKVNSLVCDNCAVE